MKTGRIGIAALIGVVILVVGVIRSGPVLMIVGAALLVYAVVQLFFQRAGR